MELLHFICTLVLLTPNIVHSFSTPPPPKNYFGLTKTEGSELTHGPLDPEDLYLCYGDNSGSGDDVGLESRRLFIGIIATSAATSLIGTNPEPASAEEPKKVSITKVVQTPGTSSSSSSVFLSDASSMASSSASAVDWNSIFAKASKRALGGGKAGASAAVVQVLSLMWLRTAMNRQYRYGGNLVSSLKELWSEGGIPRLYQGLPFALIQGPLTRFGDTASNVGILALLEVIPETRDLPLPVKTGAGSICSGLWRIFLMPVDSSKTAMQVEGDDGLKKLWTLVAMEGPGPLYSGALAQAAATAAGHFPWFLTYNYVDELLPPVSSSEDLLLSLGRSALLGLCASSVSDVTSNSLRVIKTTKQTARLGADDTAGERDNATAISSESNSSSSAAAASLKDDFTYAEVVGMIIKNDGLAGLFGRGLQTRLLTNCIQGSLFSVLFKYFQNQ